MSVDIAWDTITSGSDGAALGEAIRDFIHTKFQQIALPRFINSVHVHSFDFGTVSPDIEIKDISDPLPDFYEDDDDDDDDDDGGDDDRDRDGGGDDGDRATTLGDRSNDAPGGYLASTPHDMSSTNALSRAALRLPNAITSGRGLDTYPASRLDAASVQTRLDTRPTRPTAGDMQGLPFPRSGTPGIPGGTSNLSYFHLPVGGLSGAQTPLAAVASGTPFPSERWQREYAQHGSTAASERSVDHSDRPRTDSLPSPGNGSPFDPSSPESRPATLSAAEKVSDELNLDDLSVHTTLRDHPVNPSDLQVVAHVKYEGDIRLTLTAEILVDYPMPSFVSIPLKLSVTGMKFDGIAIIAYIRKRMHFCFLDQEDAQALVGDHAPSDSRPADSTATNARSTFGSLLREIQIESEIGRQENGKQVLKNVSKVEKFVLEQVKKIFEEEFVFPSFWTFLI